MQNQFSRTQLLLGKPAIDTLSGSRVAVFGIGGVGGYVVEVLARSGVGELDLFDDDRVCLTNVNRQIYALISTVGQHKVDVAEARIHDINRRCIVHKHQMFYMPSNADEIDLSQYDYVVDCVDTVTAKLELIKRCYALHIPIISCMGAANKLDATAFRVADINKTKMDPLAKVIRKKLRRLHIPHLKVVYSDEEPLKQIDDDTISCRFHCICPNKDMRKCTEVVKDLINAAGTMRITPEEAPTNPNAIAAAEKAQQHLQKYNALKKAKASPPAASPPTPLRRRGE